MQISFETLIYRLGRNGTVRLRCDLQFERCRAVHASGTRFRHAAAVQRTPQEAGTGMVRSQYHVTRQSFFFSVQHCSGPVEGCYVQDFFEPL
jgi:hypothetical protein